MNPKLLAGQVAMLKSGVEPFQSLALDALASYGADAVPGLCAMAADEDGQSCRHVRRALMRIGAEAIVSQLPALGSVEKISALKVLADLGRQHATQAVIDELGCEIPEVRAEAARTLGRLLDKRAIGPLERAVRDSDTAVRASAVEALGGLREEKSLPILIAATLDRHVQVRRAAVAALTDFRHPSTGDALVAALLDDDADVRARAALGVGQLERVDATQRLLAIVARDNGATRDAAVVALGRCGDGSTISPLCELLGKDEETQLSTCNALAALAARHPDPHLRAALPELRRLARTWPSAPVRVRSAAARARDVIESVTARVRNLPMPVESTSGEAAHLPIPGNAGASREAT